MERKEIKKHITNIIFGLVSLSSISTIIFIVVKYPVLIRYFLTVITGIFVIGLSWVLGEIVKDPLIKLWDKHKIKKWKYLKREYFEEFHIIRYTNIREAEYINPQILAGNKWKKLDGAYTVYKKDKPINKLEVFKLITSNKGT